MKNKRFDLGWVANLPEVGLPLRDRARDIMREVSRADAARAEAMRSAGEQLAGLQKVIRREWSSMEIRDAKMAARAGGV